MGVISVYLAGKVPKGTEIALAEDWRSAWAAKLGVHCEVSILSPEDPTLDESKPMEIFGHDCALIRDCDIVIVRADSKLGAGTSQEMIIAKHFKKAVLTVLPKETHHRRANLDMHGIVVADWIHPFIYATSDKIFDSLDNLADWLPTAAAASLIADPVGLEIIEKGIFQYSSRGSGE